MSGKTLAQYNPRLERHGFFCDICGHEANGPNGLVMFNENDGPRQIRVCVNTCLRGGVQ